MAEQGRILVNGKLVEVAELPAVVCVWADGSVTVGGNDVPGVDAREGLAIQPLSGSERVVISNHLRTHLAVTIAAIIPEG